MRRFLLTLAACLSGTAAAQDFSVRADEGERVMTTEAGDAYLAAIAPTLEQSIRTCSEEGASMASGEVIALVARVARDGAWSSVETKSAPQRRLASRAG